MKEGRNNETSRLASCDWRDRTGMTAFSRGESQGTDHLVRLPLCEASRRHGRQLSLWRTLMEGPLAAFEDWFDSLAPDVRVDLVALALMHVPGMDVPRDLLLDGDIVTPALTSIEEMSEQHPNGQVAAALAIRAAVEFFAMGTRGSDQNWDQIQYKNERARDEIRRTGGDARFVEKLLRELPLRRKQWLRVAKQWRDLSEGAWSDNNLRQWLNNQA